MVNAENTTRTTRTLIIAPIQDFRGKGWQESVGLVHKFFKRRAGQVVEVGKLDAHAQAFQGIDDLAVAGYGRLARPQMEKDRDNGVLGKRILGADEQSSHADIARDVDLFAPH